eukprot:TRINITY_DN687_c0_g1_i3.p1 TRINITY_DN687_c0_g1~~TRINITY_DN687_c0_g1_i3.p1  ORF type:complete len:225 (-),score=53.43 TRINITY_DN687_c0_g1_i3:4-678(-)
MIENVEKRFSDSKIYMSSILSDFFSQIISIEENKFLARKFICHQIGERDKEIPIRDILWAMHLLSILQQEISHVAQNKIIPFLELFFDSMWKKKKGKILVHEMFGNVSYVVFDLQPTKDTSKRDSTSTGVVDEKAFEGSIDIGDLYNHLYTFFEFLRNFVDHILYDEECLSCSKSYIPALDHPFTSDGTSSNTSFTNLVVTTTSTLTPTPYSALIPLLPWVRGF